MNKSRDVVTEAGLDQKQVVEAALALLDEAGLDGVSMRRLADKLGIKAASLYWHVRDKNHLLNLLAEEICAPVQPSDKDLSWRGQVEAVAGEYRRVLLSHRDAARVLAASGAPTGPNRLRMVEWMLGALIKAGFTKKDAANAAFLMNDFATQFIVEETQYWPGGQEQTAASTNWMSMLPPDEYPSVTALAADLMSSTPEERFYFGMEVILDGLEARLKKQ